MPLLLKSFIYCWLLLPPELVSRPSPNPIELTLSWNCCGDGECLWFIWDCWWPAEGDLARCGSMSIFVAVLRTREGWLTGISLVAEPWGYAGYPHRYDQRQVKFREINLLRWTWARICGLSTSNWNMRYFDVPNVVFQILVLLENTGVRQWRLTILEIKLGSTSQIPLVLEWSRIFTLGNVCALKWPLEDKRPSCAVRRWREPTLVKPVKWLRRMILSDIDLKLDVAQSAESIHVS